MRSYVSLYYIECRLDGDSVTMKENGGVTLPDETEECTKVNNKDYREPTSGI